MKKTKLKPYWLLPVFLLLTICITVSAKLIDLPPNFTDLLTRSQLTFAQPSGYEEATIIPNKQMNYEYAIKLPAHNFEVRYAVRPLDTLLKQYETMKKKPGTTMANITPNQYYPVSLQAILMNISGGRGGRITLFPKEAVKKEFNADWGASSMVPLGKEFGQDYKDCLVVAIHKDNIGDAYYFYMLSDKEDAKMIPSIFYIMRFK